MTATLLTRCLARLFVPAPPLAEPPGPAAEAAEAGERVLGCGWFDSSHDLQAGLRVQEHASVDAVAAEMPLGAWLAWHAAGHAAGHSLTAQQ